MAMIRLPHPLPLPTWALLALLSGCQPLPAPAAQTPTRCLPLDAVKARMHGEWTSLDANQWQFARAMSAIMPNTPPGLPYGDSAELVTLPDGSGVVWFVDGPQACDPIAVPAPVLAILKQVGEGGITREGDPS